jgi:hypothetical protein
MHWILALGVQGAILTQLGTFNSYAECRPAMAVVLKLMDPQKHGEVACIQSDDPEALSIIKPKS